MALSATTTLVIFILEHLFSIVGFLLAVVLLTQIARERRRPAGALAWVLAVVLIPYIGVPLYLLIGGRKIQKRIARKGKLYGPATPATDTAPRNDMERILRGAGMPPPRAGNQARLVHDDGEAYRALLRLIDSARDHIYVTTFILGRDPVGQAVVAALAKKAADGVRVRLLLDSLGCLRTSGAFVEPIRRAGGQVGVFLPVLPLRRRWSANLRNHRKIVVVDGVEAMVGGMNLAEQFLGPTPDPARFFDASVFLRGPAVADVSDIFARDWAFATDEILPESPQAGEVHGVATVQVVASGPDVPDDVLHDAFMTAMMGARERIWVVTPYFVPDEALLTALSVQARAGRDVRILVPARSNHRVADFARGPALRALHDAGARIYTYPHRMIHTKLLLFDQDLAVTGSPNLDMRSIYINFEIALFHRTGEEVEAAAALAQGLMEEALMLEPIDPPLMRSWLEGMASLVAPML
jgi:cardiolipin synthase